MLRLLLALIGVAAAWSGVAGAQEDRSGLTRESYRRNCLMCHSMAAPEGVSKDILEGLHPVPGLRPADVMPGITCWRRCEACKIPDRSKASPKPPPGDARQKE